MLRSRPLVCEHRIGKEWHRGAVLIVRIHFCNITQVRGLCGCMSKILEIFSSLIKRIEKVNIRFYCLVRWKIDESSVCPLDFSFICRTYVIIWYSKNQPEQKKFRKIPASFLTCYSPPLLSHITSEFHTFSQCQIVVTHLNFLINVSHSPFITHTSINIHYTNQHSTYAINNNQFHTFRLLFPSKPVFLTAFACELRNSTNIHLLPSGSSWKTELREWRIRESARWNPNLNLQIHAN